MWDQKVNPEDLVFHRGDQGIWALQVSSLYRAKVSTPVTLTLPQVSVLVLSSSPVWGGSRGPRSFGRPSPD